MNKLMITWGEVSLDITSLLHYHIFSDKASAFVF